MRFWVFLVLAFVVLLSSCQVFFLAGVYEELQDKYGIVYIYVSRNGNDANDGLSVSTPVRSLPRAMDIASGIEDNKRVEVRVEVGIYSNGDGLESTNVPNIGFVIIRPNITISGGWDSNFLTNFDSKNNRPNVSIFDGNNSLFHIIEISGVTNVVLRNIQIMRGNANGSSEPVDRGGGIYVKNVSYLVIENNVIVSDNSATNGGGLFLWGLTNSTISCDILSNRATWGGGINLQNSSYNTISGNVYGNNANQYGGGMSLGCSTYTTISGSVYNNSATNNGGGLYLYGSQNNTISGNVYGNYTYTNGGGLYLDNSTNTTISGSVYGNNANQYGGGLFLTNSSYNTISGDVHSNSANYYGGGMYLVDSANNIIGGSVYYNGAYWYGGGVYLLNSTYNTISGGVYGNSATNGGGVYLLYSDYFTNTGWITNNTADSSGGGVYTNAPYTNSYFGNVTNNTPNNFN